MWFHRVLITDRACTTDPGVQPPQASQMNGLAKRPNKTIANMFATCVDTELKTWDAALPYVTVADDAIHNNADDAIQAGLWMEHRDDT